MSEILINYSEKFTHVPTTLHWDTRDLRRTTANILHTVLYCCTGYAIERGRGGCWLSAVDTMMSTKRAAAILCILGSGSGGGGSLPCSGFVIVPPAGLAGQQRGAATLVNTGDYAPYPLWVMMDALATERSLKKAQASKALGFTSRIDSFCCAFSALGG